MAGKKRPEVEVEAIANQICIMMIKGITRRVAILEYIKKMDKLSPAKRLEKGWVFVGNKCIGTIDLYIAKAKDLFKNVAANKREEVRELYLAQLEDMYQEARAAGMLRVANGIMKSKIYLQGLGGVNVTNTNFNVSEWDVKLTAEEEKEVKEMLEDEYPGKIDE